MFLFNLHCWISIQLLKPPSDFFELFSLCAIERQMPALKLNATRLFRGIREPMKCIIITATSWFCYHMWYSYQLIVIVERYLHLPAFADYFTILLLLQVLHNKSWRKYHRNSALLSRHSILESCWYSLKEATHPCHSYSGAQLYQLNWICYPAS